LVALVTSASRGGTRRSVAIRFAAEGAGVGITARCEEGLQETFSPQLLLELDRPVYDLSGRQLMDGWQPADLVAFHA
jgi:NAD(P)-dependent dehydrogenase (short-subunit alcohol dehydrogenase family)